MLNIYQQKFKIYNKIISLVTNCTNCVGSDNYSSNNSFALLDLQQIIWFHHLF